MRAFAGFARIACALALCVGGLAKLWDPSRAIAFVGSFGVGTLAAHAVVAAGSGLELWIGLRLLRQRLLRGEYRLLAGLSLGLIALAWRGAGDAPCGCFGPIDVDPAAAWLIRCGLATYAVAGCLAPPAKVPPTAWSRAAAVVGVCVAALCMLRTGNGRLGELGAIAGDRADHVVFGSASCHECSALAAELSGAGVAVRVVYPETDRPAVAGAPSAQRGARYVSVGTWLRYAAPVPPVVYRLTDGRWRQVARR